MHLEPEPVRRLTWPGAARDAADRGAPLEWLATNGLGGYASGTVAGAMTRRFHGLLVAAHPAPLGRVMMFQHLSARVHDDAGAPVWLSAYDHAGRLIAPHGPPALAEFRLEAGLPVWQYRLQAGLIERTVLMPFRQNTVQVTYRLIERPGHMRLTLRPHLGFRPHEAPFGTSAGQHYTFIARDCRLEIQGDGSLPALRVALNAARAAFTSDARAIGDVQYPLERRRGYDHTGALWSPGCFEADLTGENPVTLMASTESWEALAALPPAEPAKTERARRRRLITAAGAITADSVSADLILAADQFIVRPATRTLDQALARAEGSDSRTVIAGYHWFTDWGRDTMISLEGLALVTGRHAEARQILKTFSHHVRDGLIPNLFPEGEREGLYHTADATLWFFHALDRYERWSGDDTLVGELLPALSDIVQRHVAGTRFNIHMSGDGLLAQGEDGYALTWMDAKVGDWVVTPRRGKAVEINALWYNALCLMTGWLRRQGRDADARALAAMSDRTRAAFNGRFWRADLGHLLDIVDGESGDDPACRPNQLLAISLAHPVLDRRRWAPVLDVVRSRLLTPRGLRSLAPGHPDYQPRYDGDLRARDAAYHQGTVWSWLIGPYTDGWLACHPGDATGARAVLEPLLRHLDEAGIGSVSEIFDGDPPHTPRGCIAQAWGVAELLRSLVRVEHPRHGSTQA